MTIYPDTSFIVATRVERDTFHAQATRFYSQHAEDTWLWSPWHRVEVFNSLRQLTRHPDKERALAVTEAKAVIRQLEADIRCGYLLHLEADWRDVLRTANEISIGNAFERLCPATDLLHVAYAAELACDRFVTFDDAQLELAKGAGLKAEKPNLKH